MLLMLSIAFALPPHDDASRDFLAAVERMDRAMAGSSTQTYTLYKREWVDGELTDEQTLHVKFRVPEDLVITYGGSKEGRVILYRGAEWNDGKLRVDPGPLLPVVSVDPKGAIAREGERYGVRESRTLHAVALISRDSHKIEAHPTWKAQVVDEGPSTVRGEAVRCFDTRSPKDEDPSLYAARTRVCFGDAHGLPVLLESWNVEDGAMRLVEHYEFVGIDLEANLSDADFDPETYGM